MQGAIDGAFSGAITGTISGALHPTHCFVAGTAVLTAAGYVMIEEIREGDLVWSWDEETGQTKLKKVEQTFENETDELVHLQIGEEEITTTPSHPFYVYREGWRQAIDLRAGDILVRVNGETVILEQIQHEILENPVKVYNFEVEDYHTYLVSELSIFVHNDCGNTIAARSCIRREKSIFCSILVLIEELIYGKTNQFLPCGERCDCIDGSAGIMGGKNCN